MRQSAAGQASGRQFGTATSSGGSAQASRGGLSANSARATHATTSKRSIVASQQRIYHVTHVRNLEAILGSRELRADANPPVDVSTALTRELRATVELPGSTHAAPGTTHPDPGTRQATSAVTEAAPAVTQTANAVTHTAASVTQAPPAVTQTAPAVIQAAPATVPSADSAATQTQTVASRVAFYFSPDASLWKDLRSGAVDEVRWSPAARSAAASDFVVLVSTIGAASGDVIVTDGDAAGTYTRFFTGDGVQRAVERAHDSETVGLEAEVLAGSSVDFASIQLIGVANDPARDRVRELVAAAGFGTKVAVYPPWFQPG